MEENVTLEPSREPKRKKRFLAIGLGIFFIVFLFFLFFYLIFSTFIDADFFAKADIGVVEVDGIISNSKKYVKILEKYEKNDKIKAVIVRVNTPGGTVAASQEIHDAIIKTKSKKPVVISMGDLATSGGYYLSCGASKIIANPGTLTGSIGVILGLVNIEDLLNWAKIKSYTIKSGKYKDIGSMTRKMTDEEKELLTNLSSNIHVQFKNAIAQGRNLKLENVDKFADGRILTGEQALKLGLVDELGSFSYAVDIAAKLAGIKGEPAILYPKKRETIYDLFNPDEDEVMNKENLKKFFQSRQILKLLDPRLIELQ